MQKGGHASKSLEGSVMQVNLFNIFILIILSQLTSPLVYLSAGVILSRHRYAGRRFDQVKQQYPAPTINMWPYLRLRESEAQARKASFDSSFLGLFYRGYEPISARLWTSPDYERQFVVALRYVFSSPLPVRVFQRRTLLISQRDSTVK